MAKPRVLPAAAFDYLMFSAEVHGGIGAGYFRAANGDPFCAYGHVMDLPRRHMVALSQSLALRDITPYASDEAVRVINSRAKRYPLHQRVSFREWAEELDVVRGDG